MQFGNPQPFFPAFLWGAFISLCVSAIAFFLGVASFGKVLGLFFGLYGTFLLAYGFSPQGQVPPQGNIFQRIRWFFTPQSAVPMHYNRPAYFAGLILLAVSFMIGAVIK